MRKKNTHPLVIIALCLGGIYLLAINLRRYMANKQTALSMQQGLPGNTNEPITANGQTVAAQATAPEETLSLDGQPEDVTAAPASIPCCAHTKAAATGQDEYQQEEPTQQQQPVAHMAPSAPVNTPDCPAQVAQTRMVKITNDTTYKMQGYKFVVTYYPDEFRVTANGVEIGEDETKAIPITNNKLDLIYYAAFKNGRISSQKYSYTVAPSTNSLNIVFGWHGDPRITIDEEQATYQGREVLN